ncbi:hypothetical protein AM1_0945 [Acaryochloris marina MBIC11017]|uniref:Uncharacterized protein n=1 Tax=Acaryochloris marina (strain MBIC 11017) TaxID=329726 RepID=B0BZR1_ACAM1|nr:hypothetical protein AM1_0945 [Acaryochloris marina MBIC11017]
MWAVLSPFSIPPPITLFYTHTMWFLVRRSDDTEDAIASSPPQIFFNLKLQRWCIYSSPGSDPDQTKQRLLDLSL